MDSLDFGYQLPFGINGRPVDDLFDEHYFYLSEDEEKELLKTLRSANKKMEEIVF